MRLVILIALICSLTSCIEKKMRDLKSPCVANEYTESAPVDPCVRRPANKWLVG